LRDSAELEGLSRGLAFRLVENLGTVERGDVSDDVRQLDQAARAVLRKYGIRFGAYHIYLPALLKPAPSQLIVQLWALKHADDETPGIVELPQLSASGRTSVPIDKTIPETIYRLVGFRPCGERAVRIDILERLADLIRPIVSWRPGPNANEPPEGAITEGGGFTVTVAMTSLLGCSGEDFSSILRALGYRLERREVEKDVATAATPETTQAAEAGATAAGNAEAVTAMPEAAEDQTEPDAAVTETETEAGEIVAEEEAALDAPAVEVALEPVVVEARSCRDGRTHGP